MQDVGFGGDDDGVGGAGLNPRQQLGGGADKIGIGQNLLRAFGVRQHLGTWMANPQLHQFPLRKLQMDDTAARPQGQLPPGLARHPRSQMAVGGKQNRLIGGQLVDDRHRVAGGHDDVRHRLNLRAAIDIGHGDMVGVGGAKGAKLIGRATAFQAASRP